MKKPFAGALEDLIDAYLEEHPATTYEIVLYDLAQQTRRVEALKKGTASDSKYLEDNEDTESETK